MLESYYHLPTNQFISKYVNQIVSGGCAAAGKVFSLMILLQVNSLVWWYCCR